MTLTVKAFARLDEAARALAAPGGAGFLGGGTLVMRAVNEGACDSRRWCAPPTRRSPGSTRAAIVWCWAPG
ncbi:MAG: hypothetical protein R3E68_05130 [Burkholderiaceae bacterium]